MSYPTSANGIIVLLNSLNFENSKYEIRAKKAKKSVRNRKKLDEDAMYMLCKKNDRLSLFLFFPRDDEMLLIKKKTGIFGLLIGFHSSEFETIYLVVYIFLVFNSF